MYKLGQFVQGKVEYHNPFGVFVDIGESLVKGLIKIPDFLDEGEMSEQMYPEIGVTVGAIVVGYNEKNCSEVYLSANSQAYARQLRHEADEALLSASIEECLSDQKTNFTNAANYVLQKNAELYRRLA